MHKKRSEIPKEIPLPRKGTKYVALASHFQNEKMPLIFVLRDLLKIARTKYEGRKICLNGQIRINGRVRKDIRFPVGLRDLVSIGDKTYKVFLEKGKYSLKENDKETVRILKVIGKRLVKGKKTQANLEDGTNLLVEGNFSVGDSFVLSVQDNKLIKIIHLKEGSKIEVIRGKYRGYKGKIVSIEKTLGKNVFKVKFDEGGEGLLLKESLLAVE